MSDESYGHDRHMGDEGVPELSKLASSNGDQEEAMSGEESSQSRERR